MSNNIVRTLTMYLPQFHRIAENDAWWGEGYTDWTAVKSADVLFEGHRQPVIPLNSNYYNLLEKDVMLWQADLMKRYGIDGQCFYHYYFQNGRMILEKPAENLLKWKDVYMPFCFCWAIGSWTRTWSKFAGNAWTDRFETKVDENHRGILLDQKYGREKDWENHFNYLLPFFKDERYIKIDGKPVFMICHSREIPCLTMMLQMWRKLAQENGFDDLFFIGKNIGYAEKMMDAVLYYAPHSFWDLESSMQADGLYRPDYDAAWKSILEEKPYENCKTYYEGFPNYDDTPRRERNGGIAFKGATVKKFEFYMQELYQKSIALGNEFVFINAWNEWGEGMYLEPDEENKYGYLEANKKAKESALKGNKAEYKKKYENRGYKIQDMNIVKTRQINRCYDVWLNCIEQGKSVAEYFHKNNIRTVAVYGMGKLGQHLVTQLEKTDIQILYIIDRRGQKLSNEYEVKSIDDELSPVDAVILTVMGGVQDIFIELSSRIDSKLISLFEILYEIM